MTKVYVTGCFDILHAGHIEFFKQAKALGDVLIVDFASDEVLWRCKGRRSTLPEAHKKAILESISYIDKVYISRGPNKAVPFLSNFINETPDILAVTEDDKYADEKKAICNDSWECKYVVLPKTSPGIDPVSTTDIIRRASRPTSIPLRVDFAGGWLDVPEYSTSGGYIVNATIDWFAGRDTIDCRPGSGLGGSAAYSLLSGGDSVTSELNTGAGWQDPAIIQETGICVWKSGVRPELVRKTSGDWLSCSIGLYDTGTQHTTSDIKHKARDYNKIKEASVLAATAVKHEDKDLLIEAVRESYKVQLGEGMEPLPEYPNSAMKYCGAGHGGYAMYLFDGDVPNTMKQVEIYTRQGGV